MADEQKIPGGRLGRLARLAAAGARTGASLLFAGDGAPAARQAAEVLGTLRGLAAKVGQMASYVDGVIPEGQRDAYETAMKTLQAAAPTSSSADIRRVIESELGEPVERLFASFEDVPIASASIGQVHRATLPDGTLVAVKVQHPGIVKALQSDLSNAGLLEGMIGAMGGRRFNSKGMLAIARTRFMEELDYQLEATRQAAFATVHAGDPRIVIPEVIRDRCSASVLTSEFVTGIRFDDACLASPNERKIWAETLWRFVFKGNLVGGMFNADPHPGNYLFQPDGRIAFLDFGCVQVVPPGQRVHARQLHRAALDRDERAFAIAAAALSNSKPGPLEALAIGYVRQCFEPLFNAPYRMTRSYAASLVESMKSMSLAARKMDDDVIFSMPPEVLFMNRLQFGFYSVLARFDVEVDYAAVEESFWDEVRSARASAA